MMISPHTQYLLCLKLQQGFFGVGSLQMVFPISKEYNGFTPLYEKKINVGLKARAG